MKIEFTKNSKKEFIKIPHFIQSKFLNSFEKLEKGQPTDIKKMVGRKNQYRLRVGNYRAILEKEKTRWLIHYFGLRGNIYLII